jgi:hypothetical protein
VKVLAPIVIDSDVDEIDVNKSPLSPDVPEVPLVADVPELPLVPDVPLVADDPDVPLVPPVPLEPAVPEVPFVPDVPLLPASVLVSIKLVSVLYTKTWSEVLPDSIASILNPLRATNSFAISVIFLHFHN